MLRGSFLPWVKRMRKILIVKRTTIIILALFLVYVCMSVEDINVQCFFNSQTYIDGAYSVKERLGSYLSACIVIVSFFILFSKNRCIKLEKLGKKTFPIFILHAFVFWGMDELGVNAMLLSKGYVISVLIYTVFLTFFCTFNFSSNIFVNIFRVDFLKKIWNRK